VLRPVNTGDARAIRDLYNYYILNTAVTFEEEAVSPGEMEERIRTVSSRYPWLVWEEDGELTGYAYAREYHERSAYRFTAEDSIYIKSGFEGRGIGKALLAALLEKLRTMDLHALMGIITIPNERSVALHEKFGFKKMGLFSEVGNKFGQWRDVGYWELFL
jgi:phosphinothricin acetyltransferase